MWARASYSSFEVLNSSLGVSGLGTAAAQPGGSLKGAHADMQCKAAGVQHDAGQKCLGLQRGDVVFLRHELQKLTHQLAGAGRIGLMADQRRVVDVAHRHAVVVDDETCLHFFVDLLAFQQALLVGIDDDQQRIRRDDVERLIGCDKVVALACIKKVLSSGPASVASLLMAMTAGTSHILQMRSTPMAERRRRGHSCGAP